VRYPVLPKFPRESVRAARSRRDPSLITLLYAPPDFDLSPYFMAVKPTLARSFNYKDIQWVDRLQVYAEQATPAPEIERAIAAVT
jgi:hypothetical protein